MAGRKVAMASKDIEDIDFAQALLGLRNAKHEPCLEPELKFSCHPQNDVFRLLSLGNEVSNIN